MAFNAAFTISKPATLGTYLFSDVSTGSDGNLTGRTILAYDAAGTLISTTTWPIGSTTLTVALLTADKAVHFIVNWASSSPLSSPSTYTASKIDAYTEFGYNFYYGLTQKISARPVILTDTDYYKAKNIFMVELDSAANAITYGNDQFSAQACIERFQYMIQNQTMYF